MKLFVFFILLCLFVQSSLAIQGCGLDTANLLFDQSSFREQVSQYLTFLPTNTTCGYFFFVYLGVVNSNVTFKISGPTTYGPLFHTIPRICFYNNYDASDPEYQPPDSIIACSNATKFELTLPANSVKGVSIDYISMNKEDWKPLWTASVTNLFPSSSSFPIPPHDTCNTHFFLIFALFVMLGISVPALLVISILYYNVRKQSSLTEKTPIF
jgi:hypothetical protein